MWVEGTWTAQGHMVIPIQEPSAKAYGLIPLLLEGEVLRNHVFHEESNSFLAKALALLF